MSTIYSLALESGVGRGRMLLMLFLAMASSFVAVLPPHFLGAIVNAVTQSTVPHSPFLWLNRLMNLALGFMGHPLAVFSLLFFLASCLAVVVRNLFVMLVSVCCERFVNHTRKACLAAITRSRPRDLERYSSGDLVHRTMMDTMQLYYLVGTPLYVLCSDILDLLWVALFIGLLDWRILAILSSVFPLLYVLGRRTGRKRREMARGAQESEAECTGYVQRLLTGLDSIKVAGGGERELRGFSRLLSKKSDLEIRSSASLGVFFCLEGALRAGGTIAAIAYAAALAFDDPVYAGSIPVLLLYSQRFYAPLGNWARFYQVIQKSVVSFRRIRDILALPAEEDAGTFPAPKLSPYGSPHDSPGGSTVASPACSPGASPACSTVASPACSPGASPANSPGASPASSPGASPNSPRKNGKETTARPQASRANAARPLPLDGKTAPFFPLLIRGGVRLDSGRRLDIDLHFDGPGLVVLRGRSGVGKTRFAKSLLSLGPVFEGEVRAGGGLLTGESLIQARPLFAYASQSGHFLPGSVLHNLVYPEEEEAADREACAALLRDLDMKGFALEDRVEEYAGNLSLGESRRLALGRALYARRPVLLLDEIDANVDAATRRKLYELVEREAGKRAVIMITHVNDTELLHINHRCILLEDGEDKAAVPKTPPVRRS